MHMDRLVLCRGQRTLADTGSLYLKMFLGLNSGHMAWQKVPLPTKPYCWPKNSGSEPLIWEALGTGPQKPAFSGVRSQNKPDVVASAFNPSTLERGRWISEHSRPPCALQ